MDITAISQLIGGVGFPVVMSIMLYKMVNEQDQRQREELKELTNSLNENTVAITRLVEKLDGGGA